MNSRSLLEALETVMLWHRDARIGDFGISDITLSKFHFRQFEISAFNSFSGRIVPTAGMPDASHSGLKHFARAWNSWLAHSAVLSEETIKTISWPYVVKSIHLSLISCVLQRLHFVQRLLDWIGLAITGENTLLGTDSARVAAQKSRRQAKIAAIPVVILAADTSCAPEELTSSEGAQACSAGSPVCGILLKMACEAALMKVAGCAHRVAEVFILPSRK